MTTYRLRDAVQIVDRFHGMDKTCLRNDDIKRNPLVHILQDWWQDGTEVARFVRARGKYRGNSIGFAIRGKRT